MDPSALRPRGFPAHAGITGFPAHAGMDPRRRSTSVAAPWFPRPRGDGPVLRSAFAVPLEVSPPTRGWTRHADRHAGLQPGFPAHAGMDHFRERIPWDRYRFPRPRGDGPQLHNSLALSIGVSPPTRGWTGDGALAADCRFGFPAHAGMDLKVSTKAARRWRFPRPRGDGPFFVPGWRDLRWVSPPTRGWTRRCRARQHSACGFPAHAGMDLIDGGHSERYRRFPRPRGDGPALPWHRGHRRAVSPPTRGWTRAADPVAVRAGANPGGFEDGERLRFPRPRGDGPLTIGGPLVTGKVSPPTRGWTPRRRPQPPAAPGFPAHAGMDPFFWVGPLRDARFPRPRGDGPPSATTRRCPHWVSPPTRGWTLEVNDLPAIFDGFPAHAGMDLTDAVNAASMSWFPRPRGDGPMTVTIRTNEQPVSPPTRGWTLRWRMCSRSWSGFPAHAGMDLDLNGLPMPMLGFPRPRGDGPSVGNSSWSTETVSPPTRGWTVAERQIDVLDRGFPAHAGMDRRQRERPTPICGFPRPRGDGPWTSAA